MGHYLRATASYTDGHGSNKNAQATTAQAVEAGANRPPEFSSTETGSREVPENTAAGESIGAPVAATDPDTGDTLTYTLGVDDAASFDIDESTGQLQTKAPLDHETKDSYTVTVTATDPENAFDTIDVTITVTNVEEAGTVTLSNNQPSASIEITATLTDPDDGVTGTSWQWAKSSDGATVWVAVGTDSPSYTPADGDVGHYLRATASYTDGHGSNKDAQATTAQAVEAGANRPPEFSSTETGSREVPENTAAGESIGAPVAATDPDTGDTLTYTLGVDDAASFDIDESTGQLQTKAPLDHETTPSYTVTVTATDPENAFDTIDVTITVTNVEEAGTVTLSNNQPSASIEITATLTDPDDGVTGTSWQWAKSSDGATVWVAVGTDSPSYTPADGDVGHYLRATASYTDGHGSNKNAQATTAQAVEAGANRPPEFSPPRPVPARSPRTLPQARASAPRSRPPTRTLATR